MAVASAMLAGWMSAAVPSPADAFERALDRLGLELSGTLTQENLARGAKVGVARFRDAEGDIACEPLSSVLSDGLRAALTRYRGLFSLGFEAVDASEPEIARLITGRWVREGSGRASLGVSIGEPKAPPIRTILGESYRFEESALPAPAKTCLVDFVRVNAVLTATRALSVRRGLSPVAPTADEIPEGTEIRVVAQVKDSWWAVVERATSDRPGATPAEGRGFAFGYFGPDELGKLGETAATARSQREDEATRTAQLKESIPILEEEVEKSRKGHAGFEEAVRKAQESFRLAKDLDDRINTDATKAVAADAASQLKAAEAARDGDLAQTASLEDQLKRVREGVARGEKRRDELASTATAADKALEEARRQRLERETRSPRLVFAEASVPCPAGAPDGPCETAALAKARDDALDRGRQQLATYLQTIPNMGEAKLGDLKLRIAEERSADRERRPDGTMAIYLQATVTGAEAPARPRAATPQPGRPGAATPPPVAEAPPLPTPPPPAAAAPPPAPPPPAAPPAPPPVAAAPPPAPPPPAPPPPAPPPVVAAAPPQEAAPPPAPSPAPAAPGRLVPSPAAPTPPPSAPPPVVAVVPPLPGVSAPRPPAAKPPPTRAGETFRDCDGCPTMVVIPAGSFDMGANDIDYRTQPVHRVTIAKAFAIGRSEVTFAEWDACTAAGGCPYRPGDRGWGRGAQPAVDMSWNDAMVYVGWLAEWTGQPYRLPSEAEWEYAARGGTTSGYWWGNDLGRGQTVCVGCGSPFDRRQPGPAGGFPPNPYGLTETLGNIAEWTADCWNDSYRGAPTDGSAWLSGACRVRVLRGGAFNSDPRYIRSASRLRYDADVRYSANGFRVARDLP